MFALVFSFSGGVGYIGIPYLGGLDVCIALCHIMNEVNMKDYAVHVELVKEYVESEVMEDGGKFGGIYFVPLSHMEVCLNS